LVIASSRKKYANSEDQLLSLNNMSLETEKSPVDVPKETPENSHEYAIIR